MCVCVCVFACVRACVCIHGRSSFMDGLTVHIPHLRSSDVSGVHTDCVVRIDGFCQWEYVTPPKVGRQCRFFASNPPWHSNKPLLTLSALRQTIACHSETPEEKRKKQNTVFAPNMTFRPKRALKWHSKHRLNVCFPYNWSHDSRTLIWWSSAASVFLGSKHLISSAIFLHGSFFSVLFRATGLKSYTL